MRNPFVLRKPFTATLFLPIALTALSLATCGKNATWSDNSRHKTGFVTVNGVRLNYLDWGGSGPALILIHGIFTTRTSLMTWHQPSPTASMSSPTPGAGTACPKQRSLTQPGGTVWSMGGNEIIFGQRGGPAATARASLDAWLAYQRNVFFPGVTDASRLSSAPHPGN